MNGISNTNAADTRSTSRNDRDRNALTAEVAATLAFNQVPVFADMLESSLTREESTRNPNTESGRQDRYEAPTETDRGHDSSRRSTNSEPNRTRSGNAGDYERASVRAKESSSGKTDQSRPQTAVQETKQSESQPKAQVGVEAEMPTEMEEVNQAQAALGAELGASAPTAATGGEAAATGGQDVQGGVTAPLAGPGGVMRLDGGWRATMGTLTSSARTSTTVPDSQNTTVRAQVFESVSRHEGLIDGKGTMRLHLNPAHLGRVEVTFVRQGGQLEVTLRVESPDAERALRDGADSLGQSLLAKGAGWSQVKVTVMGEASNEMDEEVEDEPTQNESRNDGQERSEEHGEQEGDES